MISLFSCKSREIERPAVIVRAASVVHNDSNGDGLADVLLGDTPTGALLLLGTRARWPAGIAWRWHPEEQDPAAISLAALAFAGDRDGDHMSEIAIAEGPSRTEGRCYRGGVRVYSGRAEGALEETSQRLLGPTAQSDSAGEFARIGERLLRVDGLGGRRASGLLVSATHVRVLARALPADANEDASGDARGDARGDGSAHTEQTRFCEGTELWVYGARDQRPSQRIALPDGELRDWASGRMDSDVYPDLALLAGSKIYIYRGNSQGFEPSPARVLHDDHDSPDRWSRVALGDLDGDGLQDLVLACEYTGAGEGIARAGVVHFAPLSGEQRVGVLGAPNGGVTEQGLGRSLAVVHDLNGDGRDEVVIADPASSAVLIYLGRAGQSWPSPDRVVRGPASVGVLGVGVIDAGDLDGDGRHDVLVRAARRDGAMVTLFVLNPLTGELVRALLPSATSGYAHVMAGAQSVASEAPPELPPLLRRCVIPSAQLQPELLVSATVLGPESLHIRPPVADALAQLVRALAPCQAAALAQDCGRATRASLTLAVASIAARPTLHAESAVAWEGESDDTLRECVARAVQAPWGVAAVRMRVGTRVPVSLSFAPGPTTP
ncbi:MAG: VCBS repeat-containing protein [Deltaproteobacteria bacterium]|nr:VCBS repeat-containing protein [Deltaproteobacteria bacterium]